MSNFTYKLGGVFKDGAERCYVSDDGKIQMSIYTPKKRGVWGKQETYFYPLHEKNSPEFKTEQEARDYMGAKS